MSRPSVLYVVQPDDGGVAEHVRRLALGMGDHGYDVEVAASPGFGPAPELERAGIPVHRLALRRDPGPADVSAARALRALDRERRYDIVHAHSSKAGALTRSALPGRRRQVYTPHCFAFAARFSRSRTALYRGVEQALVPRTGAIVAVCDWERRLGERKLMGAGRVLRTIENGVGRPPAVEPDAELLAFKGDEPLAGLVTVLRPQKDPVLAVRAMARAGTQGRLAIVGNGELAEAVEAEIARLGLGERVRLFPYRDPAHRYLRALDLFVLPSAWEAFPLAVLEAMSCGLPVLATAVGGVPEAVTDGVTGRLVKPRDEGAFAGALVEMLAEPAGLTAYGRAGREVAESRFTLERMVARTAALYGELGEI